MEWLWIVLGIIALSLVARLIIVGSGPARRVRRLSRFAYERHPEAFREPVGSTESVQIIDKVDKLSRSTGVHFDVACLYVLSRWANPDGDVLMDVLRAWDHALAAGRYQAKGEEVSIHSPEAAKVLQSMVEAGEAELPAIIRDFKADTRNLAPPVTSWKQCPDCGGLLRPNGDAVLCPECTRVWCDPHRWPALDEDGDLIGTQPYAPSPTEIDQGIAGRVTAWFLTTLRQ